MNIILSKTPVWLWEKLCAKLLVIKEVLNVTVLRYPWMIIYAQLPSILAVRPWLVYDAEFKREYVGDMPTEMLMHFFKSLSDAALMNLNIKAEGENEHHKIEGIFKALAKAIKMAVKRDIYRYELPSTKGVL